MVRTARAVLCSSAASFPNPRSAKALPPAQPEGRERVMATAFDPTTPLSARTREIAGEGPIVAVHFLGGTAVFVLGEASLLLVSPQQQQHVPVHQGAVLATAADRERVVTGGDDGNLIETR